MKRSWFYLLFLLAGIVIGSLVTELTAGIPWLSWLSYGLNFATESPLVLNLNVIRLTFGISVHLSISVILFCVISVLCGRALFRK